MTSRRQRIFISGAGVRSAIGDDCATFSHNLFSGVSGVRLLAGQPERGLQDYVGAPAALAAGLMPTKALASQTDRVAQLSIDVGRQALSQAGLGTPWPAGQAHRFGVYWGTGMGGASTLDATYREFYGASSGRMSPLTVIQSMVNACAGQLSIFFGARGPMLAVSNACASASQAIGEALHAMRAGRADVVLAGGAEAILAPGVVRAWQAMGVLASPLAGRPEASCRPFDQQRTGLVLGEGAAAFVLETEDHLRARDGVPLAELAGYGCSSDGVHMAKPDAFGQALALRGALDDAGVAPGQIGYINAHGTATAAGDPVEAQSVADVFGEGAGPWISSTKALHGHALGAAGAIELVATLEALRGRRVPPNFHVDSPIDVPRLALPGLCDSWPAGADSALSNSFAFGGFNAVLLLRDAPLS